MGCLSWSAALIAWAAKITYFRSTVPQQEKQIEALTASLNKQAAQIQRVNAQVELNQPAARGIAINQ